MATWVWAIIAAAAAVVIVAVIVLALRARRTARLRDRFGPEYDRTVETAGGRRDAERDLAQRERRRDELDIRPLAPTARNRYAEQWHMTQERFVDRPQDAVGAADTLVTAAMRERGYPVEEAFEQRAADISVDHPHVVDNYRAARQIATAAATGDATTEDLRQAMVCYRALFEELLVADDGTEDTPLARERVEERDRVR
jgi:hypothetical protein